jgi:phenylalanyl-tRNA synthetase beta chain
MKVTLNWLKQYVGFDWSPEELAERLTMLQLDVESFHRLGGLPVLFQTATLVA